MVFAFPALAAGLVGALTSGKLSAHEESDKAAPVKTMKARIDGRICMGYEMRREAAGQMKKSR
jgi:hypothetical protein